MHQTVTLQSYSTPEEAYVVAGMLKSNGIPAMVENLNNLYVPIFNGVNLVVYAEDADRARQLLEENGDLQDPGRQQQS